MPARYAPVLFGFILSALMSFLASGIATFRNFGFFGLWTSAWLPSWLIAFPVVLVVAPIARRVVGLVVAKPTVAVR